MIHSGMAKMIGYPYVIPLYVPTIGMVFYHWSLEQQMFDATQI